MRLRIKVYDAKGTVHNRLDLSLEDETCVDQTLGDIEEFLTEQYYELEAEEDDE